MLDKSIVHGRCTKADALIFNTRIPFEELHQSVFLYGFYPATILDLVTRASIQCEIALALHLEPGGLKSMEYVGVLEGFLVVFHARYGPCHRGN